MLRAFLTVMLAAMLVFTSTGGAQAGPAPAGGVITLSGQLEYVTNVSAPHYEVAGYVLIYREINTLDDLIGQNVVVVGTPLTEPSIYMRKAISVQSLMAAAATIPPVKGDDGKVTIPIRKDPAAPTPPASVPAVPAPAPAPADAAADQVSAPTAQPAEVGRAAVPEPIHLYGSPYYVLFGQVEAGDRSHRLVQDTPAGPAPVLIHSSTVDLSALAGQRVGLVASRDLSIPETPSYNVIAAVAVTQDVGALLKMGPIYTVPDWPISVMMHGKEIAMDQPPILGNGRTLVPLRAIGEALGARVSWDQETQTATVTLGAREVKVTVGTNRVSIQETGWPENIIYCDVAPVVAAGRTLVPVRVISESLGLKVGWDEATHTVTLH